jgi:hypothetical protein
VSKDLCDTGVVYCATGERYIAEALSSARSLRRWWKGPCQMTCDHLPNGVRSTFDATSQDLEYISFKCIAPSGNPYADKIRAIIGSPYKKTIYLDSDTYVAANPDSLFALLERYDIALAHAPGYRGQLDPKVPSAFYELNTFCELNTGVLVYRSSPLVYRFLETWLATYEAWSTSAPFDGPAKIRMQRISLRSGGVCGRVVWRFASSDRNTTKGSIFLDRWSLEHAFFMVAISTSTESPGM